MQEITFNHFYMEVKDKIEPYLYPLLNPYTMRFFKGGNIYWALQTGPDGILEVTMTIGEGIEGFRDFVHACQETGIQKVKFVCSEHNKVTLGIYKYAKAVEIERKEKFYNDDSDGLVFELDLNNSRLKRSK